MGFMNVAEPVKAARQRSTTPRKSSSASQREQRRGTRGRDVFLNLPFDEAYRPVFEAVVFTILASGFQPRSVVEVPSSSETRLERVVRLMKNSTYAIHDISVRPAATPARGGARINAPFELGLFLGLIHQTRSAKRKFLVLDREPYRGFISDLAGFDVAVHHDDPEQARRLVRDWLRVASGDGDIPGSAAISHFHREFRSSMEQAGRLRRESALSVYGFAEYHRAVTEWLRSVRKPS
jgi:hypothetical protein